MAFHCGSDDRRDAVGDGGRRELAVRGESGVAPDRNLDVFQTRLDRLHLRRSAASRGRSIEDRQPGVRDSGLGFVDRFLCAGDRALESRDLALESEESGAIGRRDREHTSRLESLRFAERSRLPEDDLCHRRCSVPGRPSDRSADR